MLEQLLTVENLIALLTLTLLEVVLGIDNVVFLTILTGKLPEEKQRGAQLLGLALAMVFRILLLFCISWVMKLTMPLFTLPLDMAMQGSGGPGEPFAITPKDLILIAGGLFLLGKATHEIHGELEEDKQSRTASKQRADYAAVLVQVVAMDMIFSLDSVITAVGMAKSITVMVIAVVVAMAVMMVFANKISAFVHRHPTMKMLALSFLLLIGMVLVADGLHFHIGKGYIYFAMGFSLIVEMLNLRAKKKRQAAQAT